MSKERDLIDNARALRDVLQYGCSDGYCKIKGPSKGMHTNGGCRCWELIADLALEVACGAEQFKRRTGQLDILTGAREVSDE